MTPPATTLVATSAGELRLGVTGGDIAAMARLEQVHGSDVAVVECPGVSPATDAAVSGVAGLPLTVRTADCGPILVVAPGGVAAVHAGWRGTVKEIARKAVSRLAELTGSDPDDFAAWIGPSIGPCCYEVGREVWQQFALEFVGPGAERRRLDLPLANRAQLEAAGIPSGRIADSGLCTRCHQHLFHSHRGSGGKKGRIDAVITLA